MSHKIVFLILLVFWFSLIQCKTFKAIYRKKQINKKHFQAAAKFCQDSYQNGSLAIINNQKSKDDIKKVVYKIGESKLL